MTAEQWAQRAVAAHAVMRRAFGRPDGLYRRDGRRRLPWSVAHLWPFERALIATLDVAGIPPGLAPGFDRDGEIERDLTALARYRRAGRRAPAYASDVSRPGWGGDVYYDDNAWVGLALVELERLRPGSGMLDRAGECFGLALSAWDRGMSGPSPGGVFWTEQGVGAGRRNHDRNTVSTAPNAQVGLHVAELTGRPAPEQDGIGPRQMVAWVQDALGGAGPGGRLYRDKIRGDGTIDQALWSYNQGSMAGAYAQLARAGIEPAASIAAAEATALAALDHYAGSYDGQPAAFNAILFRNLMLVCTVLDDGALAERVAAEMSTYAQRAWAHGRDDARRFRAAGDAPQLLHHSALVSICALLAWDRADWGKIA